MAIHDFSSQRLFVDEALTPGSRIELGRDQAHYLNHVLRVAPGGMLLVFNGRDGEWRTRIAACGKRGVTLELVEQVRPQQNGPDIRYFFAPLKHARLDYMVQKAVELGVSRLSPVFTRRTVPERVNLERMRANAIEAAEQCGIMRIPAIDAPCDLLKAFEGMASRPVVLCDETAPVGDPVKVLASLPRGPVGVLVGPEGGFDPEERSRLLEYPFVVTVSLGPRIMRADTAAVAILTLVNATLGDWK